MKRAQSYYHSVCYHLITLNIHEIVTVNIYTILHVILLFLRYTILLFTMHFPETIYSAFFLHNKSYKCINEFICQYCPSSTYYSLLFDVPIMCSFFGTLNIIRLKPRGKMKTKSTQLPVTMNDT